MDDDLIYRVLPRRDWDAARAAGHYHGAEHDRADGYLHFSTADTLAETLALHYGGQEDLVLLSVPVAPLAAALRWEPARGGTLFPHLYAPLDVTLVRAVDPLPLERDGRHRLPTALGGK